MKEKIIIIILKLLHRKHYVMYVVTIVCTFSIYVRTAHTYVDINSYNDTYVCTYVVTIYLGNIYM